MVLNEPIHGWYIQLLEAMQSTVKSMGEDAPNINFEYGNLEQALENARDREYPSGSSFIGFALNGVDARIYSYGGIAIRLMANSGSLSEYDDFCRGVADRSDFPLIIEDRYGYKLMKNFHLDI